MPSADLSVTIDDGKTSVVPGASYSSSPVAFGAPYNNYTVTVTNNGPDTVTQFNLNFAPGAGLSWAGATNPSSYGSVGTIAPVGVDPNSWVWSGLSLRAARVRSSRSSTGSTRARPARSPSPPRSLRRPGRPTPTPPTIASPTATRRPRRPTWQSP